MFNYYIRFTYPNYFKREERHIKRVVSAITVVIINFKYS